MSKQDPSDQVRFLVTCIGHTVNGRPDFQLVADDLNIVSKAAAQKRYERMLKANGVSSRPAANKAGDEQSTPKSSPTKRKAAGEGKPKRAASKKVKAESVTPPASTTGPVKDENQEEDDQGVLSELGANTSFGRGGTPEPDSGDEA